MRAILPIGVGRVLGPAAIQASGPGSKTLDQQGYAHQQ